MASGLRRRVALRPGRVSRKVIDLIEDSPRMVYWSCPGRPIGRHDQHVSTKDEERARPPMQARSGVGKLRTAGFRAVESQKIGLSATSQDQAVDEALGWP